MQCCHVIEIAHGEEYHYCDRESTHTVGGNPFCTMHGIVAHHQENL